MSDMESPLSQGVASGNFICNELQTERESHRPFGQPWLLRTNLFSWLGLCTDGQQECRDSRQSKMTTPLITSFTNGA